MSLMKIFTKNMFEKEVAQAFRDLGHKVLCGVDIAGA